MKDFSLFESSDGGELLLINDNINLADALLQIVYLALFGGNVEASTKGNEKDNQLRYDWWANDLLFSDFKERQMNSLTEKTLCEIPLSSSGRIQIQNSVEEDLRFLRDIVDVDVEVRITNINRVEIYVKLNRYKNKEDVKLQFLWDNIQKSVILKKQI